MNPSSISPDHLEHLRHLEAHLAEQIRGQDHVLPRVASVLHRGELGLAPRSRPRGSFLFLGPTGVGKTELTIAFTRYLAGDDKFFRFDMSEYQTQDSLGLLLGGKLGEVGLLGLAVAKSPTGTLLFDEIEKAHPRVLDVFLQVLDAARVTMANGEALDLSEFYIVFHIQPRRGRTAQPPALVLHDDTMERHVLTKAQRSLRPELYARITEKIVFSRLSYDVQLDIARLHIRRELALLREQGFEASADESVVSFLIRRGFHPRLGARPLRDTVEKYLRGTVADAMLAEVGRGPAEFVVCGDELHLRPFQLDTSAFGIAG